MRHVAAGIGTKFRFVALAPRLGFGLRVGERIRVEDEAPAHHPRDGQAGFGLGENSVGTQPRLGDGLSASLVIAV